MDSENRIVVGKPDVSQGRKADVYKRQALDHAQLELRPGKVMALMGENGAGKSTLMKCMFGIYKMDEGEIEYEGQKVNIPTPLDALNRGIAMVHQDCLLYTSGSIVKGIVTSISANEIQVDIGAKQTGFVKLSELTDDSSAKVEDLVKVGDELDLIVEKVMDQDGVIQLSRKKLASRKGMEEILSLIHIYRGPHPRRGVRFCRSGRVEGMERPL